MQNSVSIQISRCSMLAKFSLTRVPAMLASGRLRRAAELRAGRKQSCTPLRAALQRALSKARPSAQLHHDVEWRVCSVETLDASCFVPSHEHSAARLTVNLSRTTCPMGRSRVGSYFSFRRRTRDQDAGADGDPFDGNGVKAALNLAPVLAPLDSPTHSTHTGTLIKSDCSARAEADAGEVALADVELLPDSAVKVPASTGDAGSEHAHQKVRHRPLTVRQIPVPASLAHARRTDLCSDVPPCTPLH